MDYLRSRATPAKAVPQQAASDGPLVWIDCEMTGLDPDTEEILEIHCIITTGNLEPLDGPGWGVVVHQPASRLDQMGEWCTDMHAKTGLTEAVLASTTTPQQAAEGLLAHIRKEDIEESIAEARYYREVIFGATWSQGRETLAAEPTSDDEQWANNLM
ncbi:Oligoribonuclease like protein [Verticillium longisporum]|uniref:Oligoribonuclease like protein n=1 Tax=Verticillium longisporum TaxID=100787 RepID=A0A8I2ZSA4_VERLO|nr:Oligoribonuclease like protein [Verticillium longisporum]